MDEVRKFLPCLPGDVIYARRRNSSEVLRGVVTSVHIQSGCKRSYARAEVNTAEKSIKVLLSEFGKSVFFSEEEARRKRKG